MNDLNEFLPLLISLGTIHLGLVIYSIRDIFKYGQFIWIGKLIWIIVIFYVVITGPILYLFYGRGDRSWSKKMLEMQQQAREQIEKDKNEQL